MSRLARWLMALMLFLVAGSGSTAPAIAQGEAADGFSVAEMPAGPTQSGQQLWQPEYYRQQVKKLRAERRGWTLLIGLIAPVAAFAAVIVSLVSLFLNLRATIRAQEDSRQAQRDNQFFEALKRFGEKDSAALRASGAGLIAQLAATPHQRELYLDAAVNQLTTGLLVETDEVVLKAIAQGLLQSPRDHQRML